MFLVPCPPRQPALLPAPPRLARRGSRPPAWAPRGRGPCTGHRALPPQPRLPFRCSCPPDLGGQHGAVTVQQCFQYRLPWGQDRLGPWSTLSLFPPVNSGLLAPVGSWRPRPSRSCQGDHLLNRPCSKPGHTCPPCPCGSGPRASRPPCPPLALFQAASPGLEIPRPGDRRLSLAVCAAWSNISPSCPSGPPRPTAARSPALCQHRLRPREGTPPPAPQRGWLHPLMPLLHADWYRIFSLLTAPPRHIAPGDSHSRSLSLQ